MREASIHHLTLLACSDAEAEQQARPLQRRSNLCAVALLRWVAWECTDEWPWLLRAQGQDSAAQAAVDSLPTGLRSLTIDEFALAPRILDRLDRCASKRPS